MRSQEISVWRAGARGAGLAVAVNAAIFGLGRLFNSDFIVPGRTAADSSRQVGVGEVVLVTLFVVLLGTIAMRLAGRGPRGRRFVVALAVFVAVVSAGAPVSMAGLPSGGFLALMHLATGAVYVVTVGRVRPDGVTAPGVHEDAGLEPELRKSA